MKYPRMKCKEKKTTKVCEIDRKKIFEMKQEGTKIQKIANKFKISYTTAYFWTLSPQKREEYTKRLRKTQNKWQKEKYATNGKFRQLMIDATIKMCKNRREKDEQFNVWWIEKDRRNSKKRYERMKRIPVNNINNLIH